MKTILIILVIHWIADFVLQSEEVSVNKSKSFNTLLQHTFTYTLVWLTLFIGFNLNALAFNTAYIPVSFIWKFTFITLITHTAIDYYTSKVNSILWKQKKYHNFFVSIGFDQLLHYIQLFLTFYYLWK